MNKDQLSSSVQLISIPISVAVFFYLMWGEFSKPVSEYEFVWPILWAIVSSVITVIIASIVLSIIFAEQLKSSVKDERDKRIHSLGEYYTMGFYVLGGVLALAFAMLQLDYFWIALAVFISGALANLTGSLAKLFMYRFGIFE